MDYIEAIERFRPASGQEAADKAAILEYARAFPNTILTRENRIAHITSSGFLMNRALDRVLLAHHNIYNVWAWTGGHADGDGDLLAVALREAGEETGVPGIVPLCGEILSLDILPVWGHVKRGSHVSTHLHLSAAYVLIAPEDAVPRCRPEENSGVRWFDAEELPRVCGDEPRILAVYQKLIERARAKYAD